MRTRPASADSAISESVNATDNVDRLAGRMGVSPWAVPPGRLRAMAAPLNGQGSGCDQRKLAASARGDHLDRLAVDEGPDIGDDVRIIDLVVLDADIAEMRGEHHVVELAERVVDRQRLDVEHVEAGAGDASGGGRRDQRLLVHDGAPPR